MLNVAKQVLETTGVNSRVLIECDGVQKYTECGHILIADFDDLSKREVLNRCMTLEGISVLWESSPTGHNYHIWNLTVRSFEEIAIIGNRLGADCKHIQHGVQMGKWVIRYLPKFKENGRQYAPAPKLISTWCNESLRCQSKPHFALFIALTGKTVLHANDYDYIGLSAEIEEYLTVTKIVKKRLGHGHKR